jgi:hypothetical protein
MEVGVSDEFNYVVEVTDSYTGTPVFRGTVSQRGDFVHLQKSMYGSVATLRVHDMLAAAKVQQPPAGLVQPVRVADLRNTKSLVEQLENS